MKPKTVRRLNCSYIYTNGTLVQTFVEERGGVRIGETVDITLGFCKLSVRSKGDIWEGFRGHDNSRVARVVISSWGEARMHMNGKNTSEADLGDFENPGLYDVALRVVRS